MNDSIFTKMMMSLQEKKAEETKANLKALKESKDAKNLKEEVEIEVADSDIEAPMDEVETVEEVNENDVVEESVSQDSQIKTTNKGTEVKNLDGIKPATGKDGIPEEATKKDKKLDSINVDTDVSDGEKISNKDINKKKLEEDADLSIKTGGRLIEITDEEEECDECTEGEACPECEEAEVTEEPVEELEVIGEEPEEMEDIEEEEEDLIDESTFNPFLTKFIRDNYSNAKAVVVEGARQNKKALVLECKVLFNSGKSSKFNLALRGIVREGKVSTLRASDNGYFKAESVKSPFLFKVSYKNNVLKCEGLEYNFKTKLAEGKMKEIKGKLIRG